MRVEFDPKTISYGDLLDVFWTAHDPAHNTSQRQYRNAIFYLNDEQKQLAEQTRDIIASKLGRPVRTYIEAAGTYTSAEDYHQKYYLRQNDRLFAEIQRIYSDPQQFAASTAAARINGYLGCNGSVEQLQNELADLGLSWESQQRLADHLSSSCSQFRGFTCPAPK